MNLNRSMLVAVAMMIGSLGAMGCKQKTSAPEGSDVQPAVTEAPATTKDATIQAKASIMATNQAPVQYAPIAPPALRYENPGRAPSDDQMWIDGFHRWSGREYVWVPGHWEVRRVGYEYHRTRWVQRDGRWECHEGRWVTIRVRTSDHRDHNHDRNDRDHSHAGQGHNDRDHSHAGQGHSDRDHDNAGQGRNDHGAKDGGHVVAKPVTVVRSTPPRTADKVHMVKPTPPRTASQVTIVKPAQPKVGLVRTTPVRAVGPQPKGHG